MENKFQINLKIVETQSGERWYANYPDFPGVSGGGESKEEALAVAERRLLDMIEHYQEEGLPLPVANDNYSGRFVVRISKDLHRRISEYAQTNGVSINLVVAEAIAEKTGKEKSLEMLSKTLGKIEKATNKYAKNTTEILCYAALRTDRNFWEKAYAEKAHAECGGIKNTRAGVLRYGS